VAEDESQQAVALARGANLAPAQEVSFRHDAYDCAGLVDHRKPAHVVLQHKVCCLHYGVIGRHGHNLPRHDLASAHAGLLCLVPAKLRPKNEAALMSINYARKTMQRSRIGLADLVLHPETTDVIWPEAFRLLK
jgi:hypothetical protein